ncbi:response regulator [Bradyrhizobium sp. WSM 1704]|uniref:response regulator transcription factor n=1 Tax=Bradyrhizobium semiaridum TaxID=2821404 RepID=UPI0028985F07|nr:response regulator [Bradyrhizobium semiaridum]MCA6121238.1 response regulator [Bradyrhizobium semiaridum]
MGGAVRVLVVEDEALICSFIEDALLDGGFEACPVHSGEAALTTFRDGREGCRAPLTVNLGDGISGWELARQIREITPDFPVLYMTSASATDWESQGVDRSVLIEKPFAPAQLTAAISQLLAGATSPGGSPGHRGLQGESGSRCQASPEPEKRTVGGVDRGGGEGRP